MLSVEQALERLLSAADSVADVEAVDTMLAAGRVLAVDVVSAIDVPPLDNRRWRLRGAHRRRSEPTTHFALASALRPGR